VPGQRALCHGEISVCAAEFIQALPRTWLGARPGANIPVDGAAASNSRGEPERSEAKRQSACTPVHRPQSLALTLGMGNPYGSVSAVAVRARSKSERLPVIGIFRARR
jgi:hypothetical protein